MQKIVLLNILDPSLRTEGFEIEYILRKKYYCYKAANLI